MPRRRSNRPIVFSGVVDFDRTRRIRSVVAGSVSYLGTRMAIPNANLANVLAYLHQYDAVRTPSAIKKLAAAP